MAESEKAKHKVSARVIKGNVAINKADTPLNINKEEGSIEWIPQHLDMHGLNAYVEHSTILPQCIAAYKDNIAGFGIDIRYKADEEETPEMAAEYERVKTIVDQFNLEMDTKQVFEDVVEARERFGIAYLEVIRNHLNEVVQLEFIKDTPSVKKTVEQDQACLVQYYHAGEIIQRQKKFRRYKQELNGKTVFFKEFGDLRIMDATNGTYTDDVEIPNQANEILEFAVGTKPYGEVRWIGQVLNVDGSRSAENLNNQYFKKGRHTPMMIVVRGGSLTDDSFSAIQGYMNDIEGEKGQHAFMVLEVDDAENKLSFENDKQPSVEIKDMASMLQKDELFQDYLSNSRKKVQSAFRLPDLYTGYTTDFNRATAQTAQEITEQQVFVPERTSLEWMINNKLLNSYQLKHTEVYFKAPDITNPDDMTNLLNVAEAAGGITPNIAKELAHRVLGTESEPYEEDWGNVPLAVTTSMYTEAIASQMDGAIEKAAKTENQEIVAVLRAIKKEFSKQEKSGGSGE